MSGRGWIVVGAWLWAAGCTSSHGVPSCTDGELLSCACSDGRWGQQACSGGAFGACRCVGGTSCAPGASFACACADGSVGTQYCDAAGRFEACRCDGTTGPACVPGAEVACTCESGLMGSQSCTADGVFAPCVCMPIPELCVPGRSVPCTCSSGEEGAQVCDDDGRFGACDCGHGVDGGGADPIDGGVPRDAPPADAPRGEPDTLCPEALPPVVPTLPSPPTGRILTGTSTLVATAVSEHGIVVVGRGDVRLISRTGVERARWTATREITFAVLGEDRLAVADRAALTTLVIGDGTLVEAASVFLTEECVTGVVLSCGRFVCGPANDWDRIFYTYDLGAGAELARSEPETYNGIPMARVPGRDSFVTVTTGSSPSDFHYHRVEDDGRATFVGESPYHGDFPVTDVYAFIGLPASHLVTHEGRILRIDGCETLAPGSWPTETDGCLTLDGTLGTLRTGETMIGVDTGGDGLLYALAGASPDWSSDASCTPSSPCRAQRIDPAARRVLAERTFSIAGARDLVVRSDPWSGAVLVVASTGCSTSYPYACTGWEIHVVDVD